MENGQSVASSPWRKEVKGWASTGGSLKIDTENLMGAEEENEKEVLELEEQVENLTDRLKEAMQESRVCKQELFQVAEELEICREELDAGVQVQKQLAEALKAEQDKREALCHSIKKMQDESSSQNLSRVADLERENADLRAEIVMLEAHRDKAEQIAQLHRLRGMDLNGLKQSEINTLRSQLAEAEAKAKKEAKRAESYKLSLNLCKGRLSQLEYHAQRTEALRQKNIVETSRRKSEEASTQEVIHEKDLEIQSLREEIDSLVEKFHSSLSAKERTITELRTKTDVLQTFLHRKNEVAISQTSLLKTLDQRLDTLLHQT